MHKIILTILVFLSFGASANTKIEEELFKLNLPGDWRLVDKGKTNNYWIYQSNDKREQVTISILTYQELPSHQEKRQFLEEFVEIRKAKAKKYSENRVVFDEVRYEEYPTGFGVTYSSTFPGSRNFFTKAISNGFGIANFFYETVNFETKEFQARKEYIFSEVGFISR